MSLKLSNNINIISQDYDFNLFRYKSLEEEAKHILDSTLRGRGIKFHSITSRIKDKHSLLDKIERKNYSTLNEVNDIIGTRVVCLFLDDIRVIGECIRNAFDVLTEDNKIDESDVSTFGYMSFHFIAKLKSEYSGPRYNHIKDLNFEIQVRTISMDAWANISHYLDYKNEQDLPSDLKKDFYALSGLFYVADKHFQMFVKSSELSKAEKLEVVQQLLSGDGLGKENDIIDFDSLSALLIEKYPDRPAPLNSKSISVLIEELSSVGITRISQVVDLLENTKQAVMLYEQERPPGFVIKFQYSSVGVVRLSIAFYFEQYRKSIYKDDELSEEKYQRLIQRQ
ncbi:ppGpp synthetase/RelA/SpoT-type nucleotidyltransferase [Neobacillus bataviensis]|uniref:PpGpp synthetase/RelA/SpoT-type nucleotidyltransferase n=1 Tax=Neobacillus bataviensis TaxID=220685 RepID=A0A561DZD8_9BACI|nr:hypothetical protein [Neobacillus bataviensis]TWE08737.1 ppGpp synthetase/RelA/SpoT-type nucleotidyltransferase [Neobacillus bataviensis]